MNYVWPLRQRRARRDRPPTPGRRVIRAAAGLLDGAVVLDEADRAMLCLPEVVPLDRAEAEWRDGAMPTGPGALAQVVEALALATPAEETHDFLIGLWTPQFGYLHLGILAVDMQRPWLAGEYTLRLSGAHHPVTDERYAGPCTGYLDVEPVALPTFRWPIR